MNPEKAIDLDPGGLARTTRPGRTAANAPGITRGSSDAVFMGPQE